MKLTTHHMEPPVKSGNADALPEPLTQNLTIFSVKERNSLCNLSNYT